MNKCLTMLALSSMIAACATQPAATVEPATPAAKPKAATRVCEKFEDHETGSRLGSARVCKTVPAKEERPQTS